MGSFTFCMQPPTASATFGMLCCSAPTWLAVQQVGSSGPDWQFQALIACPSTLFTLVLDCPLAGDRAYQRFASNLTFIFMVGPFLAHACCMTCLSWGMQNRNLTEGYGLRCREGKAC